MTYDKFLAICSPEGCKYWRRWEKDNFHPIYIIDNHNLPNFDEFNKWTEECKGKTHFLGSFILFELEEDVVLFILKYI